MSTTVKASAIAIKALKPHTARYMRRVDGHRGLYVRVSPNGERSFVYRYGQDGAIRWLTLAAPDVGEAVAEWARLRQSKTRGGEDIAQTRQRQRSEKQLARAKERSDPTIAILAQRYIDEHAKPNKRSWKQDEQRLARYVTPLWALVKARNITRADVQALVAKLAKDRPVLANRILALVRKMFSFALDVGVIDAHPCLRMRAPGKERAKDRVLSDDELRVVWRMTEEQILAAEISAALRLQLLTGCRPGEAIGANWDEFDLVKAEWSLPAARSKNGLPHLIPLSPDAMRLMRAIERTSDWVFPAERVDGPLRHDRLTKLLREALSYYADDTDTFTPHDLRRTVETGLARLGIGREVRDRVLNHKDRSVSGVHYNKHDYLPEKRTALEKWAREIRRVVNGERAKVVQLASRVKS